MAFSLTKIFGGVGKATVPTGPLTSVGIDIGGSSVKVVELEETEQAVKLRTYGELQLGPYESQPLGEVVALSEQHRVEAVTDVLREAGVKSRRGTLAMPLSSSFLTVFQLPAVANGQDDLASRIPVEARKYVPLPLTDVTLDWNELAPLPGAQNSMHEIMLVAVENKALEEYRALLSAIGMTAEPAEIEAFGLVRSLWREGDTHLAIIDIGARAAKLYLVRDGVLERLHRVGLGGREITSRVAGKFNIPFEQAENDKRAYDRTQGNGPEIFGITAAVLDASFSEFGRLLGQYEARIGQPVGRVVIAGGVASGSNMVDLARDRLGRPVELADPFAKVAYPAFLEDTLHAIGPSFGVALGAALRVFQQ